MSSREFTMHEVLPGDCVSSIADHAGLLWQTIWDHPNNQQLRSERFDPNVLLPGDQVAVPNKITKEIDKPTDQTHAFVRKGTTAKVTLRMLHENEPRARVSYVFAVDGNRFEGATDVEGYLTVPIPPNSQFGTLTLTDDQGATEEYMVQLGRLDPITETIGVQQRLRNLGYAVEPTDELDAATVHAVAAFRQAYQITDAEGIDNQFRDKLKVAHGS